MCNCKGYKFGKLRQKWATKTTAKELGYKELYLPLTNLTIQTKLNQQKKQ